MSAAGLGDRAGHGGHGALGPVAAEQRIEELQRQLALSHQALEEFTFSVSHDLRAPLRHVGAYLKIVQEDLGAGVEPAILSHLQTASEAAAQMGRLMDGLLELSRAGRAQMQWCDVDMQRLVADVRRQMDFECAGRQVEWRIAPDIAPVRGDLALLGQMLVHLLGNALKFTRLAPVAVIEVYARTPKHGWCELCIRDNGVGFDPRLQGRLFRVFQRLHSSKQFEGLGVGLAFARLVVERHGGVVRARGDMAPGCEISLTLPLAAAGAA